MFLNVCSSFCRGLLLGFYSFENKINFCLFTSKSSCFLNVVCPLVSLMSMCPIHSHICSRIRERPGDCQVCNQHISQFSQLNKKKKVKSYLYNVDENDSLFLLTLKRHFEEILVKRFIFSPSNPMHKHTYFSLVFFVPHCYCIRSSSIKSFSVLFYSRFQFGKNSFFR